MSDQLIEKCNTQAFTIEDVVFRHEQEEFAFKQLTAAEQAREQVRMRILYAKDPWRFLSDCVYTLDQVSADSPIKVFPSYRAYVEFLTHLWLREKLIAVPKHRRMFCSWTFISLYTHDTIFNPGRFNAFVSKKEDDSGDLVSRAEFIYNHIPEWRIPRALLPKLKNGKMSKQPPLMEFEEIHSKIQGFPQGADQMRQFTFSGMLFDEWAFWDEAQPSYSASRPTLEGGGRLTGVSTRQRGSFFKKIVYDQLESIDFNFREIPPVPPAKVMEGVTVWRNPRNKFAVVNLEYTADPAKRDPEYIKTIRESMPATDFAMEYGDSWQTFEGKPVYGDFNRAIHIGRPKAEPGLPLLIGWDFGLTPAAILAQLVGRRLIVLHEFIETNGSISKLAPLVRNYLFQHYLSWLHAENVRCYVDPAGFQKSQTDERTCADVMRKVGFKLIHPGPITWEDRRKSVEDFLVKTYGEGPGFLIHEDCNVAIEGFTGGYRYPDREIEPAQIRPVKDKFSHIQDAIQYMCAGATQLARQHGIKTNNFTAPSYGFQQKEITDEPRT